MSESEKIYLVGFGSGPQVPAARLEVKEEDGEECQNESSDDHIIQGFVDHVIPERDDMVSLGSLSWMSDSTASSSWDDADLERGTTKAVTDLWLAVENYLYEGVPLQDHRLELELAEWTRQFPHLRLRGTKMEVMPVVGNPPAVGPMMEEVILVDGIGAEEEERKAEQRRHLLQVLTSLLWRRVSDWLLPICTAYVEKRIGTSVEQVESISRGPSAALQLPPHHRVSFLDPHEERLSEEVGRLNLNVRETRSAGTGSQHGRQPSPNWSRHMGGTATRSQFQSQNHTRPYRSKSFREPGVKGKHRPVTSVSLSRPKDHMPSKSLSKKRGST